MIFESNSVLASPWLAALIRDKPLGFKVAEPVMVSDSVRPTCAIPPAPTLTEIPALTALPKPIVVAVVMDAVMLVLADFSRPIWCERSPTASIDKLAVAPNPRILEAEAAPVMLTVAVFMNLTMVAVRMVN
jgi:hypothetical protein